MRWTLHRFVLAARSAAGTTAVIGSQGCHCKPSRLNRFDIVKITKPALPWLSNALPGYMRL